MAKKKKSTTPSGVIWGDEEGHYVFLGDGSEYPEPDCEGCAEPLIDAPHFRVLDVLARAEGLDIFCPTCVLEMELPGRYQRAGDEEPEPELEAATEPEPEATDVQT